MPTTAPVTSWGVAILTSVATALMLVIAAIPRIIGFIIIFVVGWLIARALYELVVVILRRVNFDSLAERSGFNRFIRDTGISTDASRVIGSIVYWFVLLITLVVAFDSLGLAAVSAILNQFLLWLPNLVVALVVLMLAGLAANFVYGLVRGATLEAGVGNADLLGNLARAAVWLFAILIALDQVGIATTLVNTLFIGLVFALSLALGLAFGLGGRDVAAQIVRNWYTVGQRITPRTGEAPTTGEREIPYRPGPEEPKRAA